MFFRAGAYVSLGVRGMVGQLVWEASKGRGRLEEAVLGPLPVLGGRVRARVGRAPGGVARGGRRGQRDWVRAGVGRVLLGRDFPWGDRLRRLRPVDPVLLWRGAADVLALGALDAAGVPRRRGRVALSAPRLCAELEAAAERLCPQVRGLLIDAPGGEEYARYLQAKFGLPVTPPSAGADVTAAFGPEGGRWGRCVELYEGGTLNGLELRAKGVELPPDCAGQVLALLWERGEVRREELNVYFADSMP